MPTNTRYVGSQLIPVAEGGADSALLDPTLTGLLAFVGHCIKHALDAKLAEMGGPTPAGPITDACPAGHRFPWNHNGTFMREHDVGGGVMGIPLPGLWMWGGSSEPDNESSTIMYPAYRRTIALHYIFPQLSIPLGFNARSGLMPAVERCLRAAFDECCHPTYQNGYSVDLALGLTRVQLLGIQCGEISGVPRGSRARGGSNEGHEQKFYPAVQAVLAVSERVGQLEPDPVADAVGDIEVELQHEELPVLDRILIDPEDVI